MRRRSTSVVIADVVGYGNRIAENPTKTIRVMATSRSMMARVVAAHGGRVVHQPGDLFLAEIEDISSAVESAIEIQDTLQSSQDSFGSIQYRIGVHFGEVMDYESDILGEGVNLAARLQHAAPAGGIAVSSTVREQLDASVRAEFQFMGRSWFKHIAYPVDVYFRSGVQAADSSRPSDFNALISRLPQATQPWIQMTPLRCMGKGEQEKAWAAEMTEEIYTLLAQIPAFTVFRGRGALSSYDASKHNLYRLSGSLRGDRGDARVSVHLEKAPSSMSLWSKSYTPDSPGTLLVQEQIAIDVITEVEVALTDGEHARLWATTTSNWKAWLKFQIGHHSEHLVTREGAFQARRYYEEALSHDPNYVPALISLGFVMIDLIRHGWSAEREKLLQEASELMEKAVGLNPAYPDCYALSAYISILQGNADEAIAAMNRAIELAPGSAKMIAYMAGIQFRAGNAAVATKCLENAMLLTPHYASWMANSLGLGYRLCGRLEDARLVFEQALIRDAASPRALIGLTGTYARLGEIERAREMAQKLLRVDPFFSVEDWAENVPSQDVDIKFELKADLRAAGLG